MRYNINNYKSFRDIYIHQKAPEGGEIVEKLSNQVKVKQNSQRSAVSRLFNKVKKWTVGACATICTALTFAVPASAVTINDNMDTKDMIGGIIGFIIEVAKWMGLVVVAAGIFMFVFAYKDDNAEAQSRAARFAVVGALLLGLEAILKVTGLIS